VWQERLAGSGKGYGARAAVKERFPELALEPSDLSADPRLGDRHTARRARELPLFGHRDEVPELPEIHKRRFWHA
jgi:hypothetical protein